MVNRRPLETGSDGTVTNAILSQRMHSLIELANAKMPFGKYKDRYLTDLPEAYLIWFRQRGVPAGSLGRMMEAMYEIKVNGLEKMVRQVRDLRSVQMERDAAAKDAESS
jgi:uncharacterized protein (DUF3820 family)